MKYLKSLFINILVLSFVCTPVLAGQTHYGGVLPSHSVDFRQGTASVRGLPGTVTTTIDRNANEYYYDGSNLVAVADNVARINSDWGYGAEPAVANLMPFKDFDTNWSVAGGVDYVRSATNLFQVLYSGTGASTNTLDADSVRSAASARAVKVVVTNAGAGAGDIRLHTRSEAGRSPSYITNGTTYTLSFYVKTSVAKTGLTLISTQGGLSTTFNTTTEYTKIEATFTSNATATNVDYQWRIGNKGLFDFYIDAIMFEESSFASSRWIGGDAAAGADVVVNGDFAATGVAAAKGVAGITKATPGVVTFDAAHGYVDGDIIFFSGLTEMTELNNEYWKLRSNVGDTFELSDAAIATWDSSSLDTSGFGNAETTGGNVAQKSTVDSWTRQAGWQLDVDGAGALTGKMACDGEQSDSVSVYQVALTIGDVNRLSITAVRTAGAVAHNAGAGNAGDNLTASGTYYRYAIVAGNTTASITGGVDFIGTIDDIEYVEHGSVGVTESAKLSYTLPTSPIGGALFAESLGAEINSGTLTLGLSYNITADTGGDFYAGSAVGEYFVSDGTEVADANSKVKQATNAYDSGSGMLPPHATVMAWVRFGYAESDVPNSTSSGIINVQDATVGFLYGRIDGAGTASVNSQDDSFNTPKKAYNWAADTLYKIVVQYGYLTSNVLQMRVGVDTGSGISWGSAVTYSGTYTTGTDLILAHTPFGPIDIQQLMIFSEILDDTIIDGLGL